MQKFCYILLLLLSVCCQALPCAVHSVGRMIGDTDSRAGYSISAIDSHAQVGIQGESVVGISANSIQSSVPTQFSSPHHRVPFGKHRTRTSFLRRMVVYYQSYFIVYHWKERSEASPFAASSGSVYYVYALRRILC